MSSRPQVWKAAAAKAEIKGWELVDLILTPADGMLAGGAYTIVDLKGTYGTGYGVHFYSSEDDAFFNGNYCIKSIEDARKVAIERAGKRAVL